VQSTSLSRFNTLWLPVMLVLSLLSGCGEPDEEEIAEIASYDALYANNNDNVVRVLSYRPAELMSPILERFTAETGIETELLVRRGDEVVTFFTENHTMPVQDLIVAVDSQRFQKIAETGALRKLPEAALSSIPQQWQDAEGLWLGLTWRLRAVLQPADEDYVDYLTLAEKVRNGQRVCVRDGSHLYNQGLLNWLSDEQGEAVAQAWAAAAFDQRQPIEGGDSDQIHALLQGQCDYALVNHYYVARIFDQADNQTRQKLAQLRFGPAESQGPVSLYTNISGIAVTRNGDNPAGANQLAIWLATAENQAAYAEAVYEFPAAWPEGNATLSPALDAYKHLYQSVR